MTTKEKMKMQMNSEFVRNMMKQRNAGTEDCMTSTELAREIGMPVTDMHDILIEKKVLCRKHRELRLTLKYQERGYEKYRSCFRYKKTGELKEIVYPVWTEKGQRMIKEKVNMERIVRILNQSGLQTRQYMDRKTGDQKVINSVVLKLTDGTDTFLGEITGERAVNCPKYDPQYIYKVQCSMVVREWNSQQTGEAMQATTIYVDKINMV